MNRTSQVWRPAIAYLLVLGGFALRLYRLGAQSLWYDETVSAYLASQSISGLIAHTARDIHPPGYYLLLHFWARLAGNTEFALTFFSLVFGMLLIPFSYTMARRWLGRDVALWSGLLVATSPYHIWYAQEARMYTLAALLGLMTLGCTLGLVSLPPCPSTRTSGWHHILGYVLTATAGLYVLHYFAFLLVVLNLWIALRMVLRRDFRQLSIWLLAQVAVLTLYLPWLPVAWRQATQPPVPPWRSFVPLPNVLIEAWTALSLGQSVQPRQVWPVLLMTGVLFLLGLKASTSKSSTSNLQPAALLAVYTFGPLALIYLASLYVPLYHVRYLFTYASPFYLLLGAGLAWLFGRTRPLAAVVTIAWLAGSAFSIRELHTNPRYAADDLRAAVRFIAERWRPGDAVLINAGYAYTAFLYYYDEPIAGRVRLTDFQPSMHPVSTAFEQPLLLQSGSIGGDPNLGWGDPNADFYAASQAGTAAALARLTQHFPRLWMLRIYDTVTDPHGFIRAWLAANTQPFEDQLFGGEANMRVQGFMSGTQPSPPQMTPITLEGDMTLLGWQAPSVARAGRPLDVVLWWQADAPPDQRPASPYAVSLKLWSEMTQPGSGSVHPAAQQDEWPVGSLLFTPEWPMGRPVRHPMRLWLPSGLMIGQYRLEVEMYDPATVQPLPRRDGQGHIIVLGNVAATDGQ